MASNKVPVYSTNGPLSRSTLYSNNTNESRTIDLKSTSDDALLPYLTNLPAPYAFTPDHSKTNIRFLLGYSAVAIAGFTFYADRILGWEATTSPWIIAAVVSYFILNSILTYWVWAVEAGEVYRGKRKTGETVCYFVLRSSAILSFQQKANTTIYRYRFPLHQRSSPVSTSYTFPTSLLLARSSRKSAARLPTQRGSRQMVYSTPSPSAAGWLVRLMF